MIKMNKLCSLLFAFTLGLTLCVGSTVQAKGFKNLSFMGNYVERHPTTLHVFMPFIEQTAKDLNGEVTFNYFGNNILFPEKESFTALSDGRVDFSVIRPSLFPGAMNLVTVVDIPAMAPNAIVGSLLNQDLVEKFPEIVAEYPKNSLPFVGWSSASYQLHSIKPIKTLEDLKGKKIIVWDSVIMDIVLKLGANPLRISSTDTYMSLSKGMADGVIAPLAPVRSFKISDIAKYHTMLNLGVGTFNMAVFKPLWDEFPPNIQAYLSEKGGMKMALDIGKSLEDGAIADTQWMKELGHEFYTLTDAERSQMLDTLSVFKTQWLADREKEGSTNASEILKYAEERATYYTDEYNKGTYGDYSAK